MQQRLITCLLVAVGLHGISFGQNNSIYRDPLEIRAARADSAILAIKNGALILRLTSGTKKIEELNRLANTAGISTSRQKRLRKMAQSSQEETDRINRLLVEEFSSQFDFSKVLFMYDTAVQHLKNGVSTGIFLDKNLQPDPAATLGGASYCIAYFGREPNNLAGSKVEGVLTMNSDFKLLENPFPYFVSQIKYFLLFVKRPEEKYFQLLVRRYNKALHNYFSKM
ncbi:MAG: hypothetical protein H6577_10960 [Lewinellaceae bacterium]|nr:hypothetical protein [Saprospiraceae bacterium]MCB9338633.1 hypothetical protein [Lewinellaceae bacterium]